MNIDKKLLLNTWSYTNQRGETNCPTALVTDGDLPCTSHRGTHTTKYKRKKLSPPLVQKGRLMVTVQLTPHALTITFISIAQYTHCDPSVSIGDLQWDALQGRYTGGEGDRDTGPFPVDCVVQVTTRHTCAALLYLAPALVGSVSCQRCFFF